MQTRNARCVVVEVSDLGEENGVYNAPPRDLLPWADPYIARLLARHRLQSALDDSLRFVEGEAAARCFASPRLPSGRRDGGGRQAWPEPPRRGEPADDWHS